MEIAPNTPPQATTKELPANATGHKKLDPRQALAQLHLADRTANHSYFQKVELKQDFLNVHVKQLILESPEKQASLKSNDELVPRKIFARTDAVFKSRTPKELTTEKQMRKQIISETGFSADPKAPYKSLGEPVLETQDLLFRAMHIEGSGDKKSRSSNESSGSSNKQRDTVVTPSGTKSYKAVANDQAAGQQRATSSADSRPSTSISRPTSAVHQRFQNGYQAIKSNVRQSSKRVLAVRVGVTFRESNQAQQTQVAASSRSLDPASRGFSARPGSLDRPGSQQQGYQEINTASQAARSRLGTSQGREDATPSLVRHTFTVPVVHFESSGWVDRLATLQQLEKKKAKLDEANAPKLFGKAAEKAKQKKQLEASQPMRIPMNLFEMDPEKRLAYNALFERYQAIESGKPVSELPALNAAILATLPSLAMDAQVLARRTSRVHSAAISRPPPQPQESQASIGTDSSKPAVPHATSGSTTLNLGPSEPVVQEAETETKEVTSKVLEQQIRDGAKKFYTIRQVSVQQMTDQFRKLELERMGTFRRKWEALNEIFAKDAAHAKRLATPAAELKRMRSKALEMKVAERLDGYTELVSKENTSQNPLKPFERQLLKRVKTMIEQDADIQRDMFVQLLRMVPPVEFNRDNVQKIFKFLKNNMFKFSEREYMELLNKNGYAPAQIATLQMGDGSRNKRTTGSGRPKLIE